MRTNGRRALAAIAISLLTMLALAGSANAATYTPDVFNDPDPVQPDDCSAAPAANGDDCSLREAVDKANSTEADDQVVLDAGTYELDPAKGSLEVWMAEFMEIGGGTLLVRGEGARKTIVDANGATGEARNRAFTFIQDSVGELRDLAVTGGTAEFRESPSDFDGGAILVEDCSCQDADADVLLTRVRAFGNHVDGDGGAIKNQGKLRIVQSLIDGNTAGQSGGGIENDDELDIVNSTISGNEALGEPFQQEALSEQFEDDQGNGGGIDNDGNHSDDAPGETMTGDQLAPVPEDAPYLRVESSTIAFNTAAGNGGGVSTMIFEGQPTFVEDADPIARFHNSIVSQNTADGDSNCSGNRTAEDGVFQSSEGHNIEDGTSCLFESEGDLDNDPKLASLGDNGGDTNTHALGEDSVAIDAGDAKACEDIDQRGEKRPQAANCDMGAYEAPAPKPAEQPGTPLPEPRAPEARLPRCLDSRPPLTSLKRKGLKITSRGVRLRGRSRDRGRPCASGVQRVEVSLAKVSGTDLNCRFLRRSNKFLLSPFTNCRRPIRFVARGQNHWSFIYRVQLKPGKYRAQARGYDNVRNKETPKKRRNIITFTVE